MPPLWLIWDVVLGMTIIEVPKAPRGRIPFPLGRNFPVLRMTSFSYHGGNRLSSTTL